MPAIDTFIEHHYVRIPVVENKIPTLTLVREEKPLVFDNFDDIRNFGTYIRAAYQFETLHPAFVEPLINYFGF